MLAPSNRRTASFECIEDGVLLSVTYQQVEELYYQNPSFGFYFLRLSTARLFDNIARLETRLVRSSCAASDWRARVDHAISSAARTPRSSPAAADSARNASMRSA